MPLSQCLQQAQPHAISKKATRNSSAPTGKIAAIRIPAPNATAHTPNIQQLPPLRNMPHTPLSQYQYIHLGVRACEKNRRTPRVSGGRRLFLSFLLPLLQRLEFFIEPQIALVTALLNGAAANGLQYSATCLLSMAAPHKAALAQIRHKLPEGLRQMGLEFQVQRIGLEGGKAWGVHHICPAVQTIELHMAGGVPC